MMRRLLSIPHEPLPRLRALTLWFVLLVSVASSAAALAATAAPPALRAAASLAALALGGWCLWGYRRGRFPLAGWILEAALLFVVASASAIAFRSLALFVAVLLFRTLYAPRREVAGLVLLYGAARVASIAFAAIPSPYAAASTTVGLQVAFLTIMAIMTHMVVTAAHHHAAVQRALHRSEERYRLLAGATRDVVYEWDIATGAVEWSESLTSVFGFPLPPEGSDASWWIARVHPDDRPAFDAAGRRLMTDFAEVDGYRYRVQCPNGQYATVAATAVVERAAGGAPIRVIGSVRDVSTVQRLEEQLRESQKMEAVGRLAAGLAHDFNNVLMVINGHMFMLEKKGPSPAIDQHVARVRAAVDRASGIVEQLLAFSRRQRLEATILNVNAVIGDVVQMVSPSMREGIDIVTRLDPRLAPVLADAGQLGQVLVNLALNARDAMPEGGQLSIATENVTLPSASDWARRTRLPPGDYVRLTVSDDGIGMSSDTLARVFEPFFTTKEPGKGTGLGLATAYGIVKQSSGDIFADSVPGAGTTFTLLLPVAIHVADAPAEPVASAPPPRAGVGMRVLLVEDDDDVRAFVREALVGEHFDVVTATNGAEGLALAEGRHDAFDAIIADVAMPTMNGPQMVARLRAVRRNLPVVYMTGYADEEAIAECGPDTPVLQKPLTIGQLTRALDTVIRQAGGHSERSPSDSS